MIKKPFSSNSTCSC